MTLSEAKLEFAATLTVIESSPPRVAFSELFHGVQAGAIELTKIPILRYVIVMATDQIFARGKGKG